MMRHVKDKGALIAAMVALLITCLGWVRSDAGRSQALSDLTAQVQRMETQLNQMQSELDRYLLLHDGH